MRGNAGRQQGPRMGSIAVQRAFPLDKPDRAETGWLQALDYDHPSHAHRVPGRIDNFPSRALHVVRGQHFVPPNDISPKSGTAIDRASEPTANWPLRPQTLNPVIGPWGIGKAVGRSADIPHACVRVRHGGGKSPRGRKGERYRRSADRTPGAAPLAAKIIDSDPHLDSRLIGIGGKFNQKLLHAINPVNVVVGPAPPRDPGASPSPEDELERIDKFSAEHGYTRSGFLLQAAKRAMSEAKTKGGRSEAGPAESRSRRG
jgi:hypothetical protein